MIRTQIQLPDPLYREVQRVAREQDWSIAEVLRRGAEVVTCAYPAVNAEEGEKWRLPRPLGARLLIADPEALSLATRGDQEPRLG